MFDDNIRCWSQITLSRARRASAPLSAWVSVPRQAALRSAPLRPCACLRFSQPPRTSCHDLTSTLPSPPPPFHASPPSSTSIHVTPSSSRRRSSATDHQPSSPARRLSQYTILANLTRPLTCSRTVLTALALTLAAARHWGVTLAGTGSVNTVGSAVHDSRLTTFRARHHLRSIDQRRGPRPLRHPVCRWGESQANRVVCRSQTAVLNASGLLQSQSCSLRATQPKLGWAGFLCYHHLIIAEGMLVRE
jgi:hypothetical protein